MVGLISLSAQTAWHHHGGCDPVKLAIDVGEQAIELFTSMYFNVVCSWCTPNHKPSQSGAYITTVDGQNIQTLQHALCWTPAPPNLNVSARVLAKVMLGGWFFSSIGANELQATINIELWGRGGCTGDRRGLNISSIYSSSTAQGGGGSFKDRKPVGEVSCYDSWMVERTDGPKGGWGSELSICLSIYLQYLFVSVYPSIYLSI